MPQRQLFTAAYRCGKTQQLAQAAHDALEAGTPLDHMLALTVHRPAAQALRDALAGATGCAVPTTTLRRRALTMLQEHPQAAGLPNGWDETALLSGIDRRLLMRRAWREVADNRSLFHQHGDQPGALDWVTLMFDCFSAWCGTAHPNNLPPITPADPALHELWAAYQRYLQLCHQHGVVAFNEVFNRAIDAMRMPDSGRWSSPKLLLLDDLDLFQPDELLFVSAMLGPKTTVYAATATSFDAKSSLALEQFTYGWLRRHGFTSSDWQSASPRAAQVTAVEYASLNEEAHGMAQHIAELPSVGQSWSAAAIVTFDQELVPLLQRTLPKYGIPVEDEETRDGYTLALGLIALTGLKLIANQPLTVAETVALLRQPALGIPGADVHVLAEAVARDHAEPFTDPAFDEIPRWQATISDIARARLRRVRQVTASSRSATTPPSTRIQSWLAELDLGEGYWLHAKAALESWAVDVDQRQWTRLVAFLRQSEALRESLDMPFDVADAVDVWTSAIALVEPEGKPQQHPVRIWRPEQLAGCTASVVFVAGLHEGALPIPAQPLPFADDETLTAVFGALPGFVAPQTQNRAAAWVNGQRALQRAIGRTGEKAHLSFSRTDRQGRRRLPSPVLANYVGATIDRHGRLQVGDQLQSHKHPVLAEQQQRQSRTDAMIQPHNVPLGIADPEKSSPFTVTPSAIEDFLNCPRRCFYARELRLYDVSSSPRQALGNVVHDVLHRLLADAQQLPISEQRAQQLVADYWIHDTQRWGSPLKQNVFRQLAEQAASQFARYEVDQGTSGNLFLGAELAFSWTLPETNVVIKGRIDRIDRGPAGLRVIDYKLGQHSPSINDLLRQFVPPRDADERWRPSDIQLPVYALAIEQGEIDGLELGDKRVHSVSLMYPLELYTSTGRVSPKGHRVLEIIDHERSCLACETPAGNAKVGKLCRAQLGTVEIEVRAVVERMRAGEWTPDPREGAKTCASCNFRPICSAPQ